MDDNRQAVIFDTSGLNGLLDDKDSDAIVTGLVIGAQVRLTETNLAEICGNSDQQRRAKLVGLCQRLQTHGECIKPYHSIVEDLVRIHASTQGQFNWRTVDVRAIELEAEVARPEYLNDDAIATEVHDDFKGSDQAFKELWRDAREKFPIPPEDRIVTTLADIIQLSEADGNVHWKLGADIYEHHAGKRPTEEELRAFISGCPPFKMMMLTVCLAQFHRGVRDFRLKSRYRDAGHLDLLSAVYLPYCDRFVTRDGGQYNALYDLAEFAGLTTKVVTYEEYKNSWLVAA